jgi:hypothetical protein
MIIPVFLIATGLFLVLLLALAVLFAGGVYMALSSAGNKQLNAGRRNFLGGRQEEDHALFFGIQIVIQTFGNDQLRARLAQLIESEGSGAQDKRRFMKSVAGLLLENQYAWEYGFWDYYDEAAKSISTFNQWRNEIEASMATEPDEMGSEIDRSQRFSDQKEFMIVTLMMLIDNQPVPVADDVGDYQFRPTYQQLFDPFQAIIEGVAERDYFSPATFANLLEGLRALDPRVIERDGIYVYPGTAQDGLSTMDLLGEEGWKYLTDHSIRP